MMLRDVDVVTRTQTHCEPPKNIYKSIIGSSFTHEPAAPPVTHDSHSAQLEGLLRNANNFDLDTGACDRRVSSESPDLSDLQVS